MTDGQETKNCVTMSGFLLSIEDTWYFVTAGHWILGENGIEVAKRAGCKFIQWHLDDSGGRDKMSIPFDYEGARRFEWYSKEVGYDYLAVELPDFYKITLKNIGKSPIDESLWILPEMESPEWELPVNYFIVGTPQETVECIFATRPDENHIMNKSIALMKVRWIEVDKAPEFMRKRFPRILATTPSVFKDEESGIVVKDILGMSGSPLFVHFQGSNPPKYYAVGVQSAWDDKSRIIAACPIIGLINYIDQSLGLSEMSEWW